MSGSIDSDLSSFHRFISEHLSVCGGDLSPEEALDLWRMQQPDDDAIAAVQEALQDMEEGDEGIPLDQFDRDFRQRHGLKAD